MIPDFYNEDPFPINITSEDLTDCYYHLDKEQATRRFKQAINSQSLVDMKNFYEDLVEMYVVKNFKSGFFGVFHDAYGILHDYNENKLIREVFDELKLDLTHLTGMSKEDMQLLIIPFKNIDDMEYLGYIYRKNKLFEYWKDGKQIGSNYKYIA